MVKRQNRENFLQQCRFQGIDILLILCYDVSGDGMGKKVDLTGKPFGRLTVIHENGRNRHGLVVWHCKCSCGNECDIVGTYLTSGKTQSCGCYHDEVMLNSHRKDITNRRFTNLVALYRDNKDGRKWVCKCDCGNTISILTARLIGKHTKSCGCLAGESHGMCYTRFNKIYRSMKNRCFSKSDPAYKNYGGRGITVCDRWKDSFKNFYEDMYESYLNHVKEFDEKDTTLDRIDVNGNYEPSNCRWATVKEQNNNKRNNRLELFHGEMMTISEISEKTGINAQTIIYRLNHGYDIFGVKK